MLSVLPVGFIMIGELELLSLRFKTFREVINSDHRRVIYLLGDFPS